MLLYVQAYWLHTYYGMSDYSEARLCGLALLSMRSLDDPPMFTTDCARTAGNIDLDVWF